MSPEHHNNLSEPSEPYGNRIQIFHSFEEENEYILWQYASLKPEMVLSRVTKMRLQRYPHLNQITNCFGSEVYFDQ